ncbi:MAG: imidazoleglycerol-phosphate dehydratase [Rhodobacteraceae bacterium]|nr:MAG: imidazoleglycerol-phosphate dehydratase [Paracoccaceae bacterium]
MKKIALILAATLLAAPALADDIHGIWQTKKDDNGNYGHIKVSNCGAKICGTLIKSFNADGSVFASPNIGKKIVWDMVSKGNGAYGGGKVWSPDRDKTYKSKMQLSGKTLKVKGCVGPICRDGGTWTKIK